MALSHLFTCHCLLSRVGQFRVKLQVLKVKYFSSYPAEMSSWEADKSKFLSMSTEEKCTNSGMEKFVSLSIVDTWRDYYEKGKLSLKYQPTEEDKTEFKKTSINSSHNSLLSRKVSIFRGSITQLEIDAIVNAANSQLKKGAGVDGAIHRVAGPQLQEECSTLAGCRTGDAKITGGYMLPAKYVIHTVGPQNESIPNLRSCYDRCFAVAKENGVRTIAFPCIGTGVYGFPNRLACHIACSRTRKFLEGDHSFKRVLFCLFTPTDVDIYETVMQMYFPID